MCLLSEEEEKALSDLGAHVISEVHCLLGCDTTHLVRYEFVPTFQRKSDKVPTKISTIIPKKTSFHKHCQ